MGVLKKGKVSSASFYFAWKHILVIWSKETHDHKEFKTTILTRSFLYPVLKKIYCLPIEIKITKGNWLKADSLSDAPWPWECQQHKFECRHKYVLPVVYIGFYGREKRFYMMISWRQLRHLCSISRGAGIYTIQTSARCWLPCACACVFLCQFNCNFDGHDYALCVLTLLSFSLSQTDIWLLSKPGWLVKDVIYISQTQQQLYKSS